MGVNTQIHDRWKKTSRQPATNKMPVYQWPKNGPQHINSIIEISPEALKKARQNYLRRLINYFIFWK